jgi:endonuclease YncB( thermonuclease family)
MTNFLSRFKWFILGGCSLAFISFFLIVVIAIGLFESNPNPEQIPFSNIPPTVLNLPLLTATDTPTVYLIPTATLQPTEPIEQFPIREIAFVQRVIDGDSLEVILDGELYELRYIGIDAPEMGAPYSREATDGNRQLVESQIVELEKDVSEADQYGRLLRYVYLQDGTFVNAELIRLGLAAAIAYPPDIKYQDVIASKEQEAKKNGNGIWAPPTPSATIVSSDATINIQVDPACSQFNAPGNDNENKNEEYVCLVNDGSETIDMAAWSMHDQYGWTYQFTAYSFEAGSKVKIRTGCGSDTQQDLYWCKDETAVWNNDGDCVYLLNPEGQVITEYCY